MFRSPEPCGVTHSSRRSRRMIIALTAAATLAAGGALATTAPATAGVAPASLAAAAPAKPVNGKACAHGEGVTVVVDFANLGDDHVTVGCAPGRQPSGFKALRHAGFSFTEGSFDGFLCTINGLPAQGAPFCENNQYWAYSKSDGTSPYSFSSVGGQDHEPIPVGSVEGWRFSRFTDTATAPSVAPSTLRVARPQVSTYGRTSVIAVSVDAPLQPHGVVRVSRGDRALGHARVKQGVAEVSIGRTDLVAGTGRLRLQYLGSHTVLGSSRTVGWRVRKAPSRTLVTRAPKPATTGERTVLSVQVKAPVFTVHGRVLVRHHGEVLRRGRLVHGAILVTLPRLDAGRHACRVVYSGRPNISRSVKVVRFRVHPAG